MGAVQRCAQFVALARIAQIELAPIVGARRIQPLGFDVSARLRLQGREHPFSMIGIELRERPKLRAHVVAHDVGADQPERRERARPRRHQDPHHAEFICNSRRVDRAGAAERKQRERGEIDAALRREHPHLVGHADVDDAADAGGGFEKPQAERRRDVPLQGRL